MVKKILKQTIIRADLQLVQALSKINPNFLPQSSKRVFIKNINI
jgi:hypothetical protein